MAVKTLSAIIQITTLEDFVSPAINAFNETELLSICVHHQENTRGVLLSTANQNITQTGFAAKTTNYLFAVNWI